MLVAWITRGYWAAVHAVLEPLYSSLGEVMDLGMYIRSVTRGEAVCSKNNLPEECNVLLWAVCVSPRGQIEGSIAVDRLLMQREEVIQASEMIPHVKSQPIFGG